MRAALMLSVALLTACPKGGTVLRDATVYEAELNLYHSWAVDQAQALRVLLATCECSEGSFSDPVCTLAAENVLVVEARADWHKDMSLWNAGLIKVEPVSEPPPVLPVSCPLPDPGEEL